MNTYSTSIVLYFYLFKYVDIESKYQLYILFNVCLQEVFGIPGGNPGNRNF